MLERLQGATCRTERTYKSKASNKQKASKQDTSAKIYAILYSL